MTQSTEWQLLEVIIFQITHILHMIKNLIQKFVRRYKNDKFCFDSDLPNSFLLALLFSKSISLIRGFKIIFFLKIPHYLMLGRNVKFSNTKRISIGKAVLLDDFVYLDGLGKGMLSLGDAVTIGAFSRLIISTNYQNLGEHIHIGDNVGVGSFSMIAGSGGCTIGNDTIIGSYCSVHPENHIFKTSKANSLIRQQATVRLPIKIGSNCWLGSKVTVLAGVTIGNNSVIGAGSVVNKDIPAHAIAVGVPAIVISSSLGSTHE